MMNCENGWEAVQAGGVLSQAVDKHVIKGRYEPPTLTRYGRVADLSKGGAPSVQSDSGQNSMSPAFIPSDRSIKENTVRIDTHPLGFGLYLFDYKSEHREKWGHGRQFGVMAQEVEAVMPEAVAVHPDGYKMVNYAMLGITRAVH